MTDLIHAADADHPTAQPVNMQPPASTVWITEYLATGTDNYKLCKAFTQNIGKAKTAREWARLAQLQVSNDQYNSKLICLADRLHQASAPYQLYSIGGSFPMAIYMTNHNKPTNLKIKATRNQRLYGEANSSSEGEDEQEEEQERWQTLRSPLKSKPKPVGKATARKSGRPSAFQPVKSPSPPPLPPVEVTPPQRIPLREWDETKVSSELYLTFPFLHDNRAFIAHMLNQRITGEDLCMDTINNADKLGVLLGLDEFPDLCKGVKYNILCERIWSRVQQWK